MLKLRILDANGNQISEKKIKTIVFSTPKMEHVIARARERMAQKMAAKKG